MYELTRAQNKEVEKKHPFPGKKTRVVNVKVAHIRPEYANLQEWMKDSNNVYIGRAGIVFIEGKRFPPAHLVSPWANPFKVTETKSLEEVLALYKHHLDKLLESPERRKELKQLRGKNLGCWCKPNACHGDILIEAMKRLDMPRKE